MRGVSCTSARTTAGSAATEETDAIYLAAGNEALATQHDVAGGEIWMPLPSIVICLQQGLVAAVSHAPKIDDWHGNAGCKPTKPSDSAKITTARIERELYQPDIMVDYNLFGSGAM